MGTWDIVPVKPGTELLAQGAITQHVMVIRHGLIKLIQTNHDGRSAIVGLRARDNLLGAGSAVLDVPQPLTAVAITSAVVARSPSAAFARALIESPALSWAVHCEHGRELERVYEQSASLACLSARERLGSLLHWLKRAHACCCSGEVELPFRDWELAQYLAVTRQYLSRLMHERLDQGQLRRRKRKWLLQ